MTPETFREAASYFLNKTLTLDGAKYYAFLKENDKLILAEVEQSVKS
jgi:hypothetical protein